MTTMDPSFPAWFFNFLRSQFFVGIPYPKYDFAGQTVIVTGSNNGLGLEAARQILGLNAAKVILAVRTISKGEKAAKDIVASTKKPESRVEVWHIDLGDYSSIKAFAEKAKGLDRIDAVIQNAGIQPSHFELVEQNETTITTNVVSPILFSLLMLPLMKQSAAKTGNTGRFSFVGSDTAWIAKFPERKLPGPYFDSLNKKTKSFDAFERYATSKLLLWYGVRDVTRRYTIDPEAPVIISVVTPGLVNTDLGLTGSAKDVPMKAFKRVLGRTVKTGGRTLVDAVRPNSEAERHGSFLYDTKIGENGVNIDSDEGRQVEKKFNEELWSVIAGIAPQAFAKEQS